MGQKHVLILEDETDIRVMLEAMLTSGGYRVSAVNSAAAAISKARTDPPDAVVSDLGMPGLDGYGFITMLRHVKSFNAPIVVVSGRTKEKDVEDALKAGADAFLPKPVTKDQLLARLEDVLAKRAQGPTQQD